MMKILKCLPAVLMAFYLIGCGVQDQMPGDTLNHTHTSAETASKALTQVTEVTNTTRGFVMSAADILPTIDGTWDLHICSLEFDTNELMATFVFDNGVLLSGTECFLMCPPDPIELTDYSADLFGQVAFFVMKNWFSARGSQGVDANEIILDGSFFSGDNNAIGVLTKQP